MANEFKNNFSEEIWKQTYKHHTDKNVKDTWKRVGENLASVEKDEEKYKKEFYELLKDFKFVPGGRILSNAGTEWKASYINCFVNPRDKHDIDSLNGIFQVLTDQANTLKAEGGWGCNFSFIRPRGSFIGGIGVESPGAVKFMELFDKSSEIITSGSGKESKNKKGKGKIRKGAMMGILSCLSEDTMISTLDGNFRIKDLVGKTPYLYCTDTKGNVFVRKAKKVWKVGKKKTVKVTLDDGSHIICTPDHRFLMTNGEYVEAQNLKFDDSVAYFHKRLINHRNIILGVGGSNKSIVEHHAVAEMKYGRHPVTAYSNKMLLPNSEEVHHINGNTIDNSPENLELLTRAEHFEKHREDILAYGNEGREIIRQMRKGKTIDEIYGEDKANLIKERRRITEENTERQAWNKKLKTKDYKSHYASGFKNQYSIKEGIEQLKSKRQDQIDIYIELFNSLNRKPMRKEWTKLCKERGVSYDIRRSSKSKYSFKTFQELRNEANSQIKKSEFPNHRVIKVEEWDERDVYDISVPDFHNFVANGVFVHNCNHPDIEEFISAKQSEGRLSKFNISVGCSNAFMNKVIECQSYLDEGKEIPEEVDRWDLVFPDTEHEKYKEDWFGDFDDWISKGYPVITYKTIKASELWDKIMKSTYNRNDPGVVFLDIANKTHGWNYGPSKVSKILATNPCFHGDTLIAVADGRNFVKIKDLADKGEDVPVYSFNKETGETEIKWGRNPRETGYNQKLLRITLDDDSYLDVTPNHKFILMDGREVEAKDLQNGDSLPRFSKFQDEIKKDSKLYWKIRKNASMGKTSTDFEHRMVSKFFEPKAWEEMKREGKAGGWSEGGLVVHHKDYNGLNNTPDNLQVMTWEAHNKFHAEHDFAGENNPMFGKEHKDSTKELIGTKTLERLADKSHYKKWKKALTDSLTGEWRQKVSKGKTKFELNRRLKIAKKTGLDVFVDKSGKLMVNKVCEISGKKFVTAWERREVCYAPGEAMNDPKIKEKAIENKNIKLREKSKINLHKQVMLYKDLEQELNRTPLKREWEQRCKENGISFRFNNVTENPYILKNYTELKEYSAEYNHRVKSVKEIDGEHTVYNITVEDNHTVGIVTSDKFRKDGARRLFSGVYAKNCGEQSLPSAGCCNLGSVNLTQFIDEKNNTFDFEKIKSTIRTAVRFLDNVNSKSYVPLKEYQDTMEKLRRIGIGVMGWGSSLYLLKIRYGSDEAEALKEELMKSITYTAIDESINLAIEKGPFEYCEIDKHWKGEYFKQINLPEEILEKMKKHGIRNSSLFSIQPTGNTGILANNISGGLEPIFMHEYIRTVICPTVPKHIEDKCPKYWEGEYKETEMFKHRKEGTDDIWVGKDENGVVYKIDRNRGLTKEELCEDYAVKILKEKGEWNVNANWAVTTTQLTAKEHIIDMKGFSKYIDSSVSKTINLPEDYSYEDFKNIYLDCYKTGYIKGFTTYRAGTMTSVLKSKDDNHEDDFIEIKTNTAPKRPKTLDADIYAVTARGDKFVIVVGKLGEQPYEVFGGHANGFNIKKSTGGTISKIKRGQYALSFGDVEIDDFSKHFTPQEQTIFRMASTMLRHGVPIEFICEQMQKSTDDMFSLPSAISRVLKKYIKDGQEVIGFECPECEAGDVYYQEGCKTCKSCGWSMCG